MPPDPTSTGYRLDSEAVDGAVERAWRDDAVPALVEYVRIPNVSPAYAPGWEADGHMERAVELLLGWARERGIEGLQLSVQRIPGRTPVILGELAATPGAGPRGRADTVLLYGHLDKQPAMTGWRDGLGPWTPVIVGDRLYGRGGADDGYALFAALIAIEAVRAGGGEHARIVLLIEASEESGSCDLPAHLDLLGGRLDGLGLVVCLDSTAPTHDRLWVTTSLRGLIELRLRVDVLEVGQHSGIAGGAVPSSFRVARLLLDRLEDPFSGTIRLPELHTTPPPERRTEIAAAAALLGIEGVAPFPYVDGGRPDAASAHAVLAATTWEPTLEVVAAGGMPAMGEGGNVLRPFTELALSIRIPPGVDPDEAAAAVAQSLTDDVPHGAAVAVETGTTAAGWDAPATAPWLADALGHASAVAFGNPPGAVGLGGTIPFMAMLGRRFPDAQFVITGVLGPDSNAHGPNEYLHLPTARRVTVALAHLLDRHAER